MELKISHALLINAAVAAARLVQAEKQHRQLAALHAEQMHQEWISEVASNPELWATWTIPGEPSAEEGEQLLHCNRLISFLSVKFRAGLLDRSSLRVQARWLMEREIARTYWRKFGGFREEEAMDRTDRVFNGIMARAHAVLTDRDPATASTA
jgi:hypothetical protein